MRTRTLRVFSIASLSLAVFVSLGIPAGAAHTQIPTNVNVSALGGNDAEDAIAVNPTNPSNIVAMSVLPIGVVGLFEGVSFDGGLTWTRQIIGAGDQLGEICCDQQLAWDSFGNLWMVYLFTTSGNVPIALSTDGGLTFTKVAEIAPTKPKGSRSPKNATSNVRAVLAQGSEPTSRPSPWVPGACG